MIVPVLTRHDLLDRMIASINYPVKDLIIINNGARDYDYLPVWNQWVSKMWHMRMPSNLGVASSWNLGIKSTPMSDYWLVCNFDAEWGGDSLKMFDELSQPHKLVLSNGVPEWCAFSVGWKVIEQVGLFDESFHPAYFEDNDFERRVNAKESLVIDKSFIPIAHDNSSTIKNGYQSRNDETYQNNAEYWATKQKNNDYTSGEWSLKRRRQNSWD
jgi:GT2 family glycosyltransferase